MDQQTLINALFFTVSALLGWFLRSLRDSVRELHDSDKALQTETKEINRQMSDIRELVAGDYVRRDSLAELNKDMFAKLESMRLESKRDLKDAVVELKVEISKKEDRQ